MRLLLCLDGTNTERLLSTIVATLPMHHAHVRLLHVLDVGPAEHAGFLRERYVGRGGMGPGWRAQVDAAARARGEDVLAGAEARLAELLPAGDGQPAAVERVLVAGRPEREIVQAAGEWPAELVVLCARRQDGPPPPPGPRSVGHVARFVTDHAPCPVLLLRP
jgi:nucleotide-binding universal stress UspA family protein